MVGEGWTWLASDNAASGTFATAQNLQYAMQGMVGIRPISGKGPVFEDVVGKSALGISQSQRMVKMVLFLLS